MPVCKTDDCTGRALATMGPYAGLCVIHMGAARERKRASHRRYFENRRHDVAPLETPAVAGVKPDPPVRADGRCVVCKKPRVIPKKEPYRTHALTDPFDSAPCCMAWHGVTFKTGASEAA